MFVWKCINCGAPLELEDDVKQTRCSYCGIVNNVSPPQPKPQPQPWRPPNSQTTANLLLAGLGGLFALSAGVVVVGMLVTSEVSEGPPSSPADSSSVRAADSAAARRDAVSQKLRDEVSSATLQRACTVLVEPTELRGAYNLVNTLRAGPKEPCIVVRAEAAASATQLKLWLSQPDGASITTPAPQPSIAFDYCAAADGSHNARLVPSDESPFWLTIYECPR